MTAEQKQGHTVVADANPQEQEFYTIRDLADRLGIPPKVAKAKADSLLRCSDQLDIKIHHRVEGKRGKPALAFDGPNFEKVAFHVRRLIDHRQLTTPPKEAVRDPNQTRREENRKMMEAGRQVGINLTLEILSRLSNNTLGQFQKSPLELLTMALPDNVSLNQFLNNNKTGDDPERQKTARLFLSNYFVQTLKRLWEKTENPNSRETADILNRAILKRYNMLEWIDKAYSVVAYPKEKKILEHLKTLAKKGETIKSIVNETCNHFPLPTPIEYKDP